MGAWLYLEAEAAGATGVDVALTTGAEVAGAEVVGVPAPHAESTMDITKINGIRYFLTIMDFLLYKTVMSGTVWPTVSCHP